jgi:hypothetical protein
MLVAPELGAPPLRRYSPPALYVGANPGNATEFTQEINDGLWWRLLTFFVRLTTDGNAANRTLRIEYRDDAGNLLHVNGNAVTYPASSTEDFSFSVWHAIGEWEIEPDTNLVPLAPMLLQPSWDLNVNVDNMQATDTLTRIRFTVEKFYPPDSADYDPER